MLKISLPFVLVSLLLIGCVNAATYYVKSGGNDNLDGLSDTTAWETIAKVQSSVTSGDTVYFRSQDTWTGENPLIYAVAGVTYDGSTYGIGTRATLRATSRVDSNGLVQIAKSNVTFQGFKVDANKLSMSGVAIGYTSPMPSGGISNITVRNCEITNGITTDNPNPSWYYALHVSMGGYSGGAASNITIIDNWVHHTGHEGIAIYPQTSTASRVNNILVRNNTIHNTGETGVRGTPLDISNDADNVTLEFNSIYDCPGGISIISFGPICYGAPSPNGVVVRYNMLNNTSGNGIGIQGYFCREGIDGDGEIYGNIAIYGRLSLDSGNWHNGIWKIYNNIFLTNYSAGKGSYVLDGGLYKTAMNATNVEIKNNIFQGTGLRLVRDQANALGSTGGIIHNNNLFYRTDSSADIVQTSVLSDADAVPATSVSVTHDSAYTYFTKSGGTDWTTKFAVGNHVKWSGFANAEFNNRLFSILEVTADQIKVYNIYLLASGPTETATVTGEKWVLTTMSASTLQSTWEPTAQNTNPLLINPVSDLSLSWNSPAIDTGAESRSSDISGNPIYGPPDIGPYEYQPPYQMGTDRPDISANVRIYGDGKFRNKNPPSGSQADLSIIPSSGNTRHYLDLQILKWSSLNKTWSENGTLGSTQVSHTVGDLTPGTNYDIYYTKDSGPRTKLNTLKADTSGRISFTYDKGFSSILFEVLQSYHKSDTDQDGCISEPELMAFLNRWYISSTDVSMGELMESIGYWKRGGC